jgi:hypothetical protein
MHGTIRFEEFIRGSSDCLLVQILKKSIDVDLALK